MWKINFLDMFAELGHKESGILILTKKVCQFRKLNHENLYSEYIIAINFSFKIQHISECSEKLIYICIFYS